MNLVNVQGSKWFNILVNKVLGFYICVPDSKLSLPLNYCNILEFSSPNNGIIKNRNKKKVNVQERVAHVIIVIRKQVEYSD